ncbi:MAG: type II toxin-antitoxin system VapC family toxin [Cyanobacteriota bacterium]
MYLIDTNVISEARKGQCSNPGVRRFFQVVMADDVPLFLSVISLGELRRGIDLIRHRGDLSQAQQLEDWFSLLLSDYGDRVLPFDSDAAQIWGRLRVPHPENAIDKQIAAIALLHDLTLVTRNTADVSATGVRMLNPFAAATP